MINTRVHTSRKLEKTIKKLITTHYDQPEGKFGKWNATIFHVNRKKCWLFTHGCSKYNVILTDITASDLKNIDHIFKEALYEQLVYDGIMLDYKTLDLFIGKVIFYPTDNDRSTTGFQNQNIQSLEYLKHEYASLENMPIKDLTHRLNTIPIHIGKSRKMSDFTYPKTEIAKLIQE